MSSLFSISSKDNNEKNAAFDDALEGPIASDHGEDEEDDVDLLNFSDVQDEDCTDDDQINLPCKTHQRGFSPPTSYLPLPTPLIAQVDDPPANPLPGMSVTGLSSKHLLLDKVYVQFASQQQ